MVSVFKILIKCFIYFQSDQLYNMMDYMIEHSSITLVYQKLELDLLKWTL